MGPARLGAPVGFALLVERGEQLAGRGHGHRVERDGRRPSARRVSGVASGRGRRGGRLGVGGGGGRVGVGRGRGGLVGLSFFVPRRSGGQASARRRKLAGRARETRRQRRRPARDGHPVACKRRHHSAATITNVQQRLPAKISDERSRGKLPTARLRARSLLCGHWPFAFILIFPYFPMKARVIVMPKQAVLDPQGNAVRDALHHLGLPAASAVRVGKFMEIDLDGARRRPRRAGNPAPRPLPRPAFQPGHRGLPAGTRRINLRVSCT